MAKKKQQSSSERIIFYATITLIALIALASLLFILTTSYEPVGRISVKQTVPCNYPKSLADLLRWSSARQNLPIAEGSCLYVTQKYCITENSGWCAQECLRLQRGPNGVCGTNNFPITGDIILSYEECKRLADSYASTAKNALQTVGATTQQDNLHNPCTAQTEPARTRVYSLTKPLQAYSRNEFPNGDTNGLYANEQKNIDSVEYTLCADGRARVTESGKERCSTL